MPVVKVHVCRPDSEYAFSVILPGESLGKSTEKWQYIPEYYKGVLENTSISLIDDQDPVNRRVSIATTDLYSQVFAIEPRGHKTAELRPPFLRTDLEITEPNQDVILSKNGLVPLITVRIQGKK